MVVEVDSCVFLEIFADSDGQKIQGSLGLESEEGVLQIVVEEMLNPLDGGLPES